MIEPDICIYHASCQDGLAAAWAIRQRFPNVICIPAQYGDTPPPVLGKHVVIVDFSYPRDVLIALKAVTASLTVLDHHKSAMEDLQPLLDERIIDGVFDMEKSGARLAWEWAWGLGREAPWLISYVEDRDLWRFRLDGTYEIMAWLFSYPFDLDFMTEAAKKLENPGPRLEIVREGGAILRSVEKSITELLDAATRSMVIGGRKVPVANVPYAWASQAGHVLAEGNDFAACYFDRTDGKRQFSLRSQHGFDVSAVARLYGGGGHAAAAGFTAPTGWEGDETEVDVPALVHDALAAIGFEDKPAEPDLDAVPMKTGAGRVKVIEEKAS